MIGWILEISFFVAILVWAVLVVLVVPDAIIEILGCRRREQP